MGGIDTYGVNHNNFSLRDELEYQFARQNRERLDFIGCGGRIAPFQGFFSTASKFAAVAAASLAHLRCSVALADKNLTLCQLFA